MLNAYLHRLYDSINSRGYIQVEQLVFDNRSNQRGSIRGRLHFYDNSLLDFGEVLVVRSRQVIKLRYAYHYQDADGKMIFRYDNAPIILKFTHILTINMRDQQLAPRSLLI